MAKSTYGCFVRTQQFLIEHPASYQYRIPIKTYSAVVSGRPILLSGTSNSTRLILQDIPGVFVLDPDQPRLLSDECWRQIKQWDASQKWTQRECWGETAYVGCSACETVFESTLMDVFFWQNMPTHIQAPALVELARRWGGKVHGVWVSGTTDDRKELGWENPELPGIEQHYLENDNRFDHVRQLVLDAREAIHIFSGLDAYRDITHAFHTATQNSVDRLGMMVEPGIAMGWRGRLRPLRAKLKARQYIGKIKLVLAMGQSGVQFYERAGFPRKDIFPYMYQSGVSREGNSNETISSRPREHDELKLIYVGKFIPRKGVDILLRSLKFCKTSRISLEIVGDGEQGDELRRLADQLNVSNHVRWLGAKPLADVHDHLARADLCVVPSRFEGWGVVVNESIGVGTPVICSSATTSRDLVEMGDCGAVFESEDPRDLARHIDRLADPIRMNNAASNARAYRNGLTGQNVGQYLHDVLRFVYVDSAERPQPPWYTQRTNA